VFQLQLTHKGFLMKEAQLAQLLVRHRLVLSLFSLLLTGYLLAGLQFLKFESDYKIFFDADNPQLLAHDANEDRFTRSDNIMLVIAPAGGQVFEPKFLDLLVRMTAEAWQIPYSSRVESITNFQHTWVEGDDLVVEDLVSAPLERTPAQLEQLRRIALDEPVLVRRLISDRAHVTAINVDLSMPELRADADIATAELVKFTRQLAARYEAENPGLKIHLLGQTMVNTTFNEMSKQDMEQLIPLMFLVIVILLQVILRSVAGTLSTVVLIGICVASSQGFMGWVGYALNQVNVACPIIILSIAVCDAVHLLNIYLYNLNQGQDKVQAMQESLGSNIKPIFMTSLTTAMGFISMNFSDSPPFQEVGNIAAFGVMIAFVFTLTLLPGLIMLFPKGRGKAFRPHPEGTFSERVGRFAVHHHRVLFIGMSVAAVILAVCSLRNDLNDDTVGYFAESVPFRQAAEFTQDHLTGFDMIAYAMESGQEYGVNEPDFLRQVEAFKNWYLAQPEVVHVLSFTDTIKRLNRNMNGDDPTFYRIPDDRELIAQYVLLYEMSLPFGLDLTNQIDSDKSSMLLRVIMKEQKSKDMIALDQRAQDWLAANAPELQVPGASVSVMFAHIGQRNIESMISGSFVAMLLVTLTLIVSLGSLRYGLLSLLPNAFPALMAFGIWGIFVSQVNLAVAVIFAITLGIVVDDTVHFLTKYLKARQEGKSTEEAIHYAFRIVGKAIVTTTLVLASGFFLLAFSDFDVNASMGIMVGLTVVIALLWDFLFLPALLMLVDRGARRGVSG
jgi:predicted RND superfamily exporter protein